MQFSLMFFSSDAESEGNRYAPLLSCVEFADQNRFAAVWLPERHFHRFGGLFPNPSVIGAAVAARTKNLRIRAGSVVLPLHDPIRVAEEWSVVDNLSGGRVDLAFAQGWNPNDFVLAPDRFGDRLQATFSGIDTIRALWRGEKIKRRNGVGADWEVAAFPQPVQRDLQYWVTCTKGVDRFEEAGRIGANVLTALLMQDVAELKEKIRVYRSARANSSNPSSASRGLVTLMLHTFVGENLDATKNKVRPALTKYIADSVDLWRQRSIDLASLTEKDRQRVLGLAFERYFRESSLCGTPESLLPKVKELHEAGVDEIACLIDFGLPASEVLGSLRFVSELREAMEGGPTSLESSRASVS